MISKTRLAQFDQIPTLVEALPGTEIEVVDGHVRAGRPALPKPIENKALRLRCKTVLADP